MGKLQYTKEQLEFIRNNYIKLSANDIASKIGITEAGVRYIVNKKLGVGYREFGTKSKGWSKQEMEILGREDLSDYEKVQLLPGRTDTAVRAQRLRLGFKSRAIIFNREFENQGYKFIRTNGTYKREHRLVCELNIGRKLRKDEDVHHIDGNKLNNEFSNLYICSRNKHSKVHYSCFRLVQELMERGLVYFDKEEGVYKYKDV